MKKLLLFVLLLLPAVLHAQDMASLAAELESQMKTLKAAEGRGDKKGMARGNADVGGTYLRIGKLPSESIQGGGLVGADKKENLKRCIEYSQKAVDIGEEVGELELMKTAYQNMYAAQKAAGKVGDAVRTYSKIQTLNHAILNPQKAKELEAKRLEYEHKKREDSIKQEQEAADERARQQQQVLAQQQQQIEASKQSINNAQKEKENVNRALQKSQSDLDREKSNVEEKVRQLSQAEQEKALVDAKLELQAKEAALAQAELEKKDRVIEQRKRAQYIYLSGLGVLLIFTLLIYRSFAAQKKFNVALLNEKKRSEELLLNILPAEVAKELIKKGFADAKHFFDVTVLFTDFVNFTTVAENMTPQQLVSELHVCFKAFDVILGKYHIEKIKTVGDAYMAVSGLPSSNPNHAADIVAAAIEIRDFMQKRKAEVGAATFGIRVGINSGNVVAGIVGLRKFSYDIWGDTVNIAARMEQNSEEGKINISESTYQLIKDKYPCIYRGKIEAKNKGSIDMYYLN